MSQLKVNAISDAAGANGNAISLATNGTCTAKVTNNLSNRNLLINGAMQVAQRATTNNTAGASSTYKTLDRWMVQIQSGTVTESQQDLSSSDTGPWQKGFRKYMRLLNQSGIGAGSAQYAEIDQRIEAQNIAQSGWDYTDSAKNITLSFWVRASVAQAYVAVIYSNDGTQRHYPFEIKDSGGSTLSANTWTKITKTIPGYSGITVNNDTGVGLTVSFIAAYGTDWTSSSGTFDAWNTTGAGNDRFPDMTSTWATTTNATFDLTGVQLEVSDYATEYEFRSYGDELAKCERYYEVQRMNTGTGGYYAYSNAATGNTRYHNMSEFRCHKRASPTVTLVATANVNTPTLFPSSTHIGLYHQSGSFYLTCNHDTVVWTIAAEL